MKLFDKIFRRDAVQYEAGRAAMEKGGFYRDALRRLRRDPMAVIKKTRWKQSDILTVLNRKDKIRIF